MIDNEMHPPSAHTFLYDIQKSLCLNETAGCKCLVVFRIVGFSLQLLMEIILVVTNGVIIILNEYVCYDSYFSSLSLNNKLFGLLETS